MILVCIALDAYLEAPVTMAVLLLRDTPEKSEIIFDEIAVCSLRKDISCWINACQLIRRESRELYIHHSVLLINRTMSQ